MPGDPRWILTEHRRGLSIYQSGGRLVVSHPRLGWVLRPTQQTGERMYWQDDLVYDVAYATDAFGLRLTESSHTAALPAQSPAVPFFGCSFAFGQGVATADTLPSAFEQAAAGRARAFNFGVMGGGTHTVATLLELGSDQPVLAGRPVPYGVYVAVHHHLRRIQGEVPWAAGYPRYELERGALVSRGQFPPPKTRSELDWGEAWRYEVNKSHLAVHLVERLPNALGLPDEAGVALFLALVRKADGLFRERYGAPFVVVLWDDFGPDQEDVVTGLRALGVRVFTGEEVFPAFDAKTHYLPHYRHPSAQANRELARFLLERLPNIDAAKPAANEPTHAETAHE
jgi:hypothetical protein